MKPHAAAYPAVELDGRTHGPMALTLDGRRLRLGPDERCLVEAEVVDPAEVRAALDQCARRVGLATPVADRVAPADAILRRTWERPLAGHRPLRRALTAGAGAGRWGGHWDCCSVGPDRRHPSQLRPDA